MLALVNNNPPPFRRVVAFLNAAAPLNARLILHIAHLIGINPTNIESGLPQPFVRDINLTSRRIEVLYRQAMTMQYDEQSEELYLYVSSLIQEGLRGLVQRCYKQSCQQLMLANVSTFDELEQKQDLIAQCQAKAFLLHLQGPGQLDFFKHRDRQAIVAFKGGITESEEVIIDYYWDFLNSSQKAEDVLVKSKRQIHSILQKIYLCLNERHKFLQSAVLRDKKVDAGDELSEHLNRLIVTTLEGLQEKKRFIAPHQNKLFEYFFLVIQWKMRTLGNYWINHFLHSLSETHTKKVEELALSLRKENDLLITATLRGIRACSKKISDAQSALAAAIKDLPQQSLKLDEASSLLDRGKRNGVKNDIEHDQLVKLINKIIKSTNLLQWNKIKLPKTIDQNQQKLVDLRQRLISLRQKTDKDFTNEIRVSLEFDPQTFFSHRPMTNSFLEKILEVEGELTFTDKFQLSSDMHLGGSSQELIQHFCERLQAASQLL